MLLVGGFGIFVLVPLVCLAVAHYLAGEIVFVVMPKDVSFGFVGFMKFIFNISLTLFFAFVLFFLANKLGLIYKG